MEAVSLFCRFTLALILLAASVAKLHDRTGFVNAITGYRLLSPTWSQRVATWLPRVELACGLMLGAGILLRPVAAVVTVLLVVLTGAIAVNLGAGRRIACACFGEASNRPANGWTLARNCAFIAAAVVVAAHPPTTIAATMPSPSALPASDGLALLICTTALMLTTALVRQTVIALRPPKESDR